MRCSSKKECYHVMCPSSPEMVISAVYCRKTKTDMQVPAVYDESGLKSTVNYFSKMEQRQQQQRDVVKVLLENHEQLILWGTGGLAASLINDIPELLDKVMCFVDNDLNKQSNTFFGKTVIAPDKLEGYPKAIIMICIMMNSDSVIEQIHRMKLPNKIFTFL